jgi:hypothetical protein
MEIKPKQYLILVGGLLFVFSHFIACGAKMYQVSLEGDMPEHALAPETRDPSSDAYGIHASHGWVQIPIEFRFSKTMNKDQRDGILKAMQTWEIATGRQLFKLAGFDEREGDSFGDLYSSLEDLVNGHYLDQHWGKTGKPEVVLATTIWDNDRGDTTRIKTADIRFNTEYYILGDSYTTVATQEREVADMQSLATHELGHKLGLAHIDQEDDPHSIMNPSLYIGEGLANRKVSRGDIVRIQKIYGCEGEACDVDATLERIEKMDTGFDSSTYIEEKSLYSGSEETTSELSQ